MLSSRLSEPGIGPAQLKKGLVPHLEMRAGPSIGSKSLAQLNWRILLSPRFGLGCRPGIFVKGGKSLKGCRPGIFKKMKFFIAGTRILNIFES